MKCDKISKELSMLSDSINKLAIKFERLDNFGLRPLPYGIVRLSPGDSSKKRCRLK